MTTQATPSQETILRAASLLALLAVIGVAVLLAWTHGLIPIGQHAEDNCMIGVQARLLDARIKITGSSANDLCHKVTVATHTSLYTGSDPGTSLCSHDWPNAHVTLYAGNGFTQGAGTVACNVFQNAPLYGTILSVLLKIVLVLSG